MHEHSVLLLVKPRFPDLTLQSLLKTSYPFLESHSQRVYGLMFDQNSEPLHFDLLKTSIWGTLVPWSWRPRRVEKATQEDIQFAKMRWGFLGLTLGTLATYWVIVYNQVIAQQEALHNEPGEEGVDEGQSSL